MKNGRLLFSGLLAAIGIGLGIAGCGGNGHHCDDCNVTSYTGAYQGSGINSSGVFSATLNIDNDYNITGTEAQLTGGSGSWTVAGSLTNQGNATITLTPTSGSAIVETGTMTFVAPGVIQVAFYATGSSTPIPVTIATPNAGIWSGTYTGTYTSSNGTSGPVSVTINNAGTLTGQATPSGGPTSTLTGSVGATGVVSLNITPPNSGATTYQGAAAYNISDQLAFTTTTGGTTFSMNLTYESSAIRPSFRLRQ